MVTLMFFVKAIAPLFLKAGALLLACWLLRRCLWLYTWIMRGGSRVPGGRRK